MDAKVALVRMWRLAVGIAGRFSPMFGPIDASGSSIEKGAPLSLGGRLHSDRYWVSLGEFAGSAARRGDFGPMEAMLDSQIPMLGLHAMNVHDGLNPVEIALDAVAEGRADRRLAEKIACGMLPVMPASFDALRPMETFEALCLCEDAAGLLARDARARRNLEVAARDFGKEMEAAAGKMPRFTSRFEAFERMAGRGLSRSPEQAREALGELWKRIGKGDERRGSEEMAIKARAVNRMGALALIKSPGESGRMLLDDLRKMGATTAEMAKEMMDYGELGLDLRDMGIDAGRMLLESLEPVEREEFARAVRERSPGVFAAWEAMGLGAAAEGGATRKRRPAL